MLIYEAFHGNLTEVEAKNLFFHFCHFLTLFPTF